MKDAFDVADFKPLTDAGFKSLNDAFDGTDFNSLTDAFNGADVHVLIGVD